MIERAHHQYVATHIQNNIDNFKTLDMITRKYIRADLPDIVESELNMYTAYDTILKFTHKRRRREC